MKAWDIGALEADPHTPRILSSGNAARVVMLTLAAGESLQDHEVHERAWLMVVAGQIQVTAGPEGPVQGDPGMLFEFAPQERHEVLGRSDARLLLLLAPWPGDGHPGAMTLEQKSHARADAADHLARSQPADSE
jgi:quercetin dioxygenase-like cupin family protein